MGRGSGRAGNLIVRHGSKGPQLEQFLKRCKQWMSTLSTVFRPLKFIVV